MGKTCKLNTLLKVKKILRDLNKWENILCSIKGRLDVVKMLFLSKLICKFNAIPKTF